MNVEKKYSNSAAGFTLVELMVAAGLIALLMLAVGVASTATLRSNQQTGMRFIRNQIVNQLRLTANSKKAMITTIHQPENQALYNCICGVGTCANVSLPLLPITLYDSAGTIQSPAYYDTSGGACNPAAGNCPIRVQTTFFAQCVPDLNSANQNPPAQCDGVPAEFVAIMYTVDKNPDAPGAKDLIDFKPISGPAYLSVADLVAGGGTCP